MKKFGRLVSVLMLVMVAAFALTACGGLDMNKIKGDWTVSTINGMSPAEFAASVGTPEFAGCTNYTITDKTFESSNIALDGTTQGTSLPISVKANGFEVLQDGQVFMSVAYDDKADTLSFGADIGGTQLNTVLKRGKTDIDALYNEYVASQSGAGGEEYVEDGGEEYYEEGGEEYYEEDGGEEYYEEEE